MTTVLACCSSSPFLISSMRKQARLDANGPEWCTSSGGLGSRLWHTQNEICQRGSTEMRFPPWLKPRPKCLRSQGGKTSMIETKESMSGQPCCPTLIDLTAAVRIKQDGYLNRKTNLWTNRGVFHCKGGNSNTNVATRREQPRSALLPLPSPLPPPPQAPHHPPSSLPPPPHCQGGETDLNKTANNYSWLLVPIYQSMRTNKSDIKMRCSAVPEPTEFPLSRLRSELDESQKGHYFSMDNKLERRWHSAGTTARERGMPRLQLLEDHVGQEMCNKLDCGHLDRPRETGRTRPNGCRRNPP